MIEKNGGPEGLDLSGHNLSDIDLSGANLKAVNLSRAKLYRANLSEAFLEHAIFREARCWRTNMTRASLWAADLRLAVLDECDMREASMWAAALQGASMTDAKLVGADLRDALFSETRISRESLGGGLIQENASRFRKYLYQTEERLVPIRGTVFSEAQLERRVELRYREAREIYMTLKNNFFQIGRYDDASWAYFQERQMEKETYHPRRVRQYYGDELPEACSVRSWRWWTLYARYALRWLLVWATELSCGYGERPLRVVLWAAAILLFFPFLYWLSAGIVNTMGLPVRWIDYFHYSLAAFSTIGFPDLAPADDVGKLLTSLEALLGISTLALLMFALGNRISRS